MDKLIWGLIVAVGTAILGYGAYIVVKGIIDKKKIKEEMLKKKIRAALIKKIDSAESVVKLQDLDSSEEFELKGDGIASDIRESELIYAT